MKALRFDRNGGPEVLRFEEVPLPAPGPGEVRIRHRAVALNFRDVLVRRGQHAVKSFPSGLGTESAGVIEAVGQGVSGLAVGDRVATVCRPEAACAEARIAPAARVVKLPDAISERTAASMMVRGMTARYLLRATYNVKPGDTIVIHAAAGGVGLIVSQWAKHLGATVIGTVGSDAKAAVARAHGCDHVFQYENFFRERVRDITGGKGVPVVYDSVGKVTFANSLKCLAPRGVLASFGESSGDPPPVSVRELGNMGSVFVTHPSLIHYVESRAELVETTDDLFGMVGSGKIKIEINHEYPLAEVAGAHADVEARKTTGSVVLIPLRRTAPSGTLAAMPDNTRQTFRAMLAPGAALILPGVANALAARVVADCGFGAAYVTGAGIANTFFGIPDNGLVTMSELVDHVVAIREVFAGPLMVDADTGFGNALNMRRTIRTLERAGADAIQIEDQVFPKRCGHFEGKEVIPAADMVGKIKAAVDARTDADLLIVARTDAIAVEGFNAAMDRAQAFREAGADVGFVEAPLNDEQMTAIARLPWPQIANIVIGGKTPERSHEEMQRLGFAGVLYANTALQAAVLGMQRALTHLKQNGRMGDTAGMLASFKERQRLIDIAAFQAMERKYK